MKKYVTPEMAITNFMDGEDNELRIYAEDGVVSSPKDGTSGAVTNYQDDVDNADGSSLSSY
jgi:hypothetical protein